MAVEIECLDELPDRLVERLHDGAFPVTVWRKHRGLTQNELASRAEMSPAELRGIEEAKRLRDDQAERLGPALGVSPDCLYRVTGRFRSCEEALADLPED